MVDLLRLSDVHVPPRRVTWIGALLILSIFATVAAVAIKTYRGDGTSLNAFLFLDLQWSTQDAARLERICLAMVLAVTAIGMLRPVWYFLLPASVWILLESILKTQVGGEAFHQLSPGAAALRYSTPIAVALLLRGFASGRTNGLCCWSAGAVLLRIATGVTFLSHGYEALQHNAGFIDLVIGSSARHMDVWLEELQVTRMLSVIGVLDILVGGFLLFAWNRYVLAWAAVWGLITALSRMTSLGWGAYPEVLYRATHFVVPFALLLLVWSRIEKDGETQTIEPKNLRMLKKDRLSGKAT